MKTHMCRGLIPPLWLRSPPLLLHADLRGRPGSLQAPFTAPGEAGWLRLCFFLLLALTLKSFMYL